MRVLNHHRSQRETFVNSPDKRQTRTALLTWGELVPRMVYPGEDSYLEVNDPEQILAEIGLKLEPYDDLFFSASWKRLGWDVRSGKERDCLLVRDKLGRRRAEICHGGLDNDGTGQANVFARLHIYRRFEVSVVRIHDKCLVQVIDACSTGADKQLLHPETGAPVFRSKTVPWEERLPIVKSASDTLQGIKPLWQQSYRPIWWEPDAKTASPVQ